MTARSAQINGMIKARARAEGIELTPLVEPLFARDLARFQEIAREVRTTPRPRTSAEILEDEMRESEGS